jgi:hypothetical protein
MIYCLCSGKDMFKSIDESKIINLNVIAMLKKGDRLRTRSHHYSIDTYTSMFSYKPIIRYFNGEGKVETIDSISKLITSCVKQIGDSKKERQRLAKKLKKVFVGVHNLSDTYIGDATARAGLSYIKELIEDFIVSVDPTYIRETNITEVEYDTDEEVSISENIINDGPADDEEVVVPE